MTKPVRSQKPFLLTTSLSVTLSPFPSAVPLSWKVILSKHLSELPPAPCPAWADLPEATVTQTPKLNSHSHQVRSCGAQTRLWPHSSS